jgi:hypothetical protein
MNHGGRREGAGRKTKAEEMGLPNLIEEVIGDEGKKELVKGIFDKARSGSFLHQQMLMHYIYGKPQDHVDVTTQGEKMQGIIQEVVFRNYGDSGENKT